MPLITAALVAGLLTQPVANELVPASSAGVTLELVSKRVTLPSGVRLHYMEGGDPNGEAIILLHGYSDSWYSYSRVMRDLLPLGRVLAVDQRGHGDSDRPATGYSPREMALDVIGLMDALGLERATLVGHSMGSVVAQHAAATAPARAKRLVLIGSSSDAANAGMKELRTMVYAEGDTISQDFVREFQVSTIHRPVPPTFLEEVIAISRRMPTHAWRGVIDGLAGEAAAAPLSSITSPTLILWGTRDAVFSRAEQDALRAGIRGSTLKIYEEIGHAVHWEDPSRVASDIAAFVRPDLGGR